MPIPYAQALLIVAGRTILGAVICGFSPPLIGVVVIRIRPDDPL